MNRKVLASVAAAALTAGMAAQTVARDYISIVGSSTVYPFATVVIENFGKKTPFKTPVIESTGSGGGLKLFCAGVGEEFPDITNASRAIKSSEIELCASNGINEIVEVKLGYDGIAFANSKETKQFDLTLEDLFNALSAHVVVDGSIVENPYKTWKDVNPTLPATKIEVLGPPPTSGTRDAFVELVMEEACEAYPMLEDADQCTDMREDGAFIEAGENDNLIIQKLKANPDAFGIFGYSFLDQNSDVVQGSKIGGVAPEFEAIASGDYPVSRPLFFYVKAAHVGVIPGMKEYLAEFTSRGSMGQEGYLADKGLIPLPRAEYNKVVSNVRNLKAM
jgi:phosphate transport system substrate-binding protein